MTSSVVVVRDAQLGLNLSYHRLMVLSPETASIRVVEQRGLDRAIQRGGGEVDVAILLGAPPQVMVAAATSPPDDVDEYRIAQALADTPLVPARTVDLPVPAETEIVIEGRITAERAAEGPFIDLTQTLDIVRSQPVVQFSCVTMRREACYHALLPGQGDHATLMGLPREADIFREVNGVCECLDVAMRPGGCCWLHAVVQIRKRSAEDPQRAVDATLKAHPSIKLIVVVDEDVDPQDDQMVEWAVATRFQADRDVIVYEKRPSSSLDPSALHVPGQKSVGAKLGIDATAVEMTEAFRRMEYPPLPPERLRELLGEG
jgi:UbiD family decarboxylase